MHPSQFKQLVALLRSQSDASKEGLEEQKRAINDASQTAEKQMGEIPGVVFSTIKACHEDLKTYIDSQREKEEAQNRIENRFKRNILLATWATAVFTGLAFAAAGYYAWVASGQLAQMIDSTNASVRAANVAADSYEATYGKDGQVDRIMRQTIPQTAAQIKAANSARDAAQIASESLRLSQQARIIAGVPVIRVVDPETDIPVIFIPMMNIGQLPNQDTTIRYAVIAAKVTTRDDFARKHAGEITRLSTIAPFTFSPYFYCSGGSNFPSLSQRGPDFSLTITAPFLTVDPSPKNREALFVSGDVVYNDGFPKDGKSTHHFCFFNTKSGGSFSACMEEERVAFSEQNLYLANRKPCNP